MSEKAPNVLVVDDERAIRRFLNVSLNAHGYVVFDASTGEEALNAAMTHRPDLIILIWAFPI
jgi:two-component system KDP operon response regulator KdpE